MPSDAHLNLNHQSAATTIHTLPEGGWDDRFNPTTGMSEVGFRFEDTMKAVQNKRGDKTSQYLMEPSMLQNHHLMSRFDISTTSNATKEHLAASSKLATDMSMYQTSLKPLTTDTLNSSYPLSSSVLASYHPAGSTPTTNSQKHPTIQATGVSHPRILEGVPAGLMMTPNTSSENGGGSYPVLFTVADGSAQRSMAAQRTVQLVDGVNKQVTALPRRFDPMSCDFDVKNLYSTSS